MLRALSITRLVAINIVVALCLLELGLRVQQKIGPLIDLDLRDVNMMSALSEELNHVPAPGEEWDHDRFRKMETPNSAQCSQRILFLGDSFMQGVQRIRDGEYITSLPSDTVPVHVRRFFREELGKELCVFNAGLASYSPSIFVPQAKKLIPLVRPDIVVIDVDETDLWDDYYRYRELVTRDDNGSIAAVRPTPLNVQFLQGLVTSTNKTLYVHRLFSKLYFTRIEFPRMHSRYNRPRPADNLVLAKLSAAELMERHGLEIEYFRNTLEDLTQTVVTRMGTPNALIYIHHPHLGHLSTAGGAFNNLVSEILRDVASRHDVRYYDATEDLRQEFREEPQKYYIPDDMHFNSAGTRAYGTAVAKYLARALGDN
jgi:hypothetical protein